MSAGAAPFSDEARYGPRYLPTDGTSGAVDVTYVWAPLEYGMLLARGDRGPSLDDRYMRRALTCGRAAGRWSSLMEELFSGAQREEVGARGSW